MTDKLPTKRIFFNWTEFTPDLRQNKPSNPRIGCSIKIAIDVPLDPSLILNSTQICAAQLTNQNEDDPIFTPLGMRYCIDQFEIAMSNKQEKSQPEAEDTTDWDSGNDEKSEDKSKNVTWDDFDEEEKSDNKDQTWDENWER